ncbi:MAG TPA: M20/M25/M40 family metallo-hydrolase [Candidatus Limnocylindria bacterium]
MRSRWRPLAATLVLLLVLVASGVLWWRVAGGLGPPLADRLEAAISTDRIMDDLATLQRITDEGGGSRAAGSAAYLRAADFVAGELRKAGFTVQLDSFTVSLFGEVGSGSISVGGTVFHAGVDFRPMIFSPSGQLTGDIVPVDFRADAAPDSAPRGVGCDPEDLDGTPAGAVLLVQGGGCPARQIVDNAAEAGAAAIVISYPAYQVDEVRRPTLRTPDVPIPVVGATHAMGVALDTAARDGQQVTLDFETSISQRPAVNVIAETPGGNPDEVVMLGGHLDSVIDGPGINDDGSGTMTVLEIARQLAGMDPARKVRVAFWAAEEIGLYGSFRYTDGLNEGQADAIEAYLNFDMLGSGHGVRLVYDDADAAAGSELITDAFEDYFTAHDLAWAPENLGGASDHFSFQLHHIPTGGLFSGASERASREIADRFGLNPNQQLDGCYHLACDRLDRINRDLLDQMAHAAAYVTGLLASGEISPRR